MRGLDLWVTILYGWLFLVDGCGFALFFPPFLQWVRSATSEGLAEIFFLQWPVVFVVVGCNFDGWLWLCFGFFLFLFFLQWVVVAMVVPVACIGGGCGGLWLLQWWL